MTIETIQFALDKNLNISSHVIDQTFYKSGMF